MDEPPKIIVRAFGDEPCVLFALALQSKGGAVNVSRDYPPSSYIGWTIADAFDYYVDDFQELWSAFKERKTNELARLYHELGQRPRAFVELLQNRSWL